MADFVIWKTVLSFDLTDSLATPGLPKGAVVRNLGLQDGQCAIWYECDPDQPVEIRQFLIVPTGGEVPADGEYIDTFMVANGQMVFHVYEVHRADEGPAIPVSWAPR